MLANAYAATDGNITLPLDLLNLFLAAVLPILTAVITKRFAGGAIKSIVLLGLSTLAVYLQSVFANAGVLNVRDFLYTTSLQFLLAVGLHFGLLKPTGVTGADGAISKSIPGGVGSTVEAGEPPRT